MTSLVKWNCFNFHCDNCSTGIVQVLNTFNARKKELKSEVSGCLDCKKSFGIKQAQNLKPYKA